MSLNINRVHLAGRLTADPARREYEGGAVANFTLAINRKLKDGREDAVFVDCSAFGSTGDHVSKYCVKGSGLYVEGRLQLDKWQTKEGEARQRLKVVADFVQFTTPREQSQDETPHEAPARPVAQTTENEPPF